MSLLWINGALIDKAEARVSLFDHGFLYGDGVWEPLRATRGCLVRPEEHLDSLFRSAKCLNLEIPLTRSKLLAAIEETLAANHRTGAYVRIIVTRGPGTLGPDPRKIDPQVIVIAEQYYPFPRELYAYGLHAAVYPTAIDSDSPLFLARTLGQPHVPLAKLHALLQGCLEAILVNRTGHIAGATEGTTFVVKAGEIIMPADQPPEVSGLAVAALAAGRGMTVREASVPMDELRGADELVLAGTAAGVIGIVRIDGREIGTGTEGVLTRRLREAFDLQ